MTEEIYLCVCFYFIHLSNKTQSCSWIEEKPKIYKIYNFLSTPSGWSLPFLTVPVGIGNKFGTHENGEM